MRRSLNTTRAPLAPMLCLHCRSLPPALRGLPRGGVPGSLSAPALLSLVCARCGAPAGPGVRPRSLPDTVRRLEAAGLLVLHPLLCPAA
jgi:hypothetical protein